MVANIIIYVYCDYAKLGDKRTLDDTYRVSTANSTEKEYGMLPVLKKNIFEVQIPTRDKCKQSDQNELSRLRHKCFKNTIRNWVWFRWKLRTVCSCSELMQWCFWLRHTLLVYANTLLEKAFVAFGPKYKRWTILCTLSTMTTVIAIVILY